MKSSTKLLLFWLCSFIMLPLCSAGAFATNYYVSDPRGPDGVSGTVDDVDASDSYAGTLAQPFATLTKAGTVAVAGDTVLIMGGHYNQTLRPVNTGRPDSVVTYTNYDLNEVVIKDTPGLSNLTQDEIDLDQEGRQYGIYLYGLSNIVIEGLSVTEVSGWARVVKCRNIMFRGNSFTRAQATGTTGSVKFLFSDNNKVLDNTLHDGNDNLLLIHSDSNLVARNNVKKGRHCLWCIRAGNFNVIKDNYFHNEIQKIGEIYDAENDPPLIFDTTKYNLVEGNTFAKTPSSGDASPYAGIQFAGQRCIIRNNLFYETVGPGLDLTLYSDEARYNYENRIYNNVFYRTDFAGVNIAGSTSYTFYDNILKNNIFYKSIFVANDERWPWYTDELEGKPVQVLTGRKDGFLIENNNFFNEAADELYLITYGNRTSNSNPPQHEVSWWETNNLELFRSNIEMEPQFVNAVEHDFKLQKASPMIDAGTFLTFALGQGNGTELPVADVKYFYSGFGIEGETGDRIQLAGQSETATIVAIDYKKNVLFLDRSIAWTDSQKVSLAYEGDKPDLGAFEYDETAVKEVSFSNGSIHNDVGVAAKITFSGKHITITFALSQTRAVTFGLFSQKGSHVGSYSLGTVPAGVHNFTINIHRFGRLFIAGGIYFLQLKAGVSSSTVKCIYVR